MPAVPLWRRAVALGVDYLVAVVVAYPLGFLFEAVVSGLSEEVSFRVLQLIGATTFVTYAIVMTLTRGSTIGKELVRLRIISAATGRLPTNGQTGGRFIVLGLSLVACQVILPLFAPLPVVLATLAALVAPVLLRPDRRALHDLMAGTMVITAPPREADA